MSQGWIPAWRKLFDPSHPLAPDRRSPASKIHAWLDLCQMATHKPRETRASGTLNRGELVASFRTLGKRWGWSKDRVLRFISELSTRTAIETLSETPDGTVYRIVNYDTYAVRGDDERDTNRDSNRDRGETEARQEQEVNNKTRTTYPPEFEELWTTCKRGSKSLAMRQYRKAVPSKVDHPTILTAWKAHVSAAREPRFVKSLELWIRDERWEEATPGTNGNGKPATIPIPGSASRFVR